ncbi:MAG TPA: hypothetical protein VN154_10060 [Rhizomicrobium sp.]|nr:hypothetical protein [Rhizomicrobium sp.]
MGQIGLVAPLIVGIAGVVIFVLGLGHLFGGRPVRGSAHFVGGAPLAIGGFALALLGLNTQTYARLTHEGPVAEVTVKLINPQQSLFAVTVRRLDGVNGTLICELQGDDWVLSGRVQKWKAWANVLGLDATYTLNQLSNMYASAERANGKMITACDIQGPPPDVNKYVPSGWLAWLQEQAYTVDRRFGDANYMPMVDGAVYTVVITQSGFNTVPDNDIARHANDRAG